MCIRFSYFDLGWPLMSIKDLLRITRLNYDVGTYFLVGIALLTPANVGLLIKNTKRVHITGKPYAKYNIPILEISWSKNRVNTHSHSHTHACTTSNQTDWITISGCSQQSRHWERSMIWVVYKMLILVFEILVNRAQFFIQQCIYLNVTCECVCVYRVKDIQYINGSVWSHLLIIHA